MARKRVIIGQDEWEIYGDEEPVINAIRTAMAGGSPAELQLLDGSGAEVTVFINTKAVPTVVVDPGTGPKPSEISGSVGQG